MSIFTDSARPNTSFGRPNAPNGESFDVVQRHKRRERNLPSFSEYRPLYISDAESHRDMEYVYRRRTRLKQLRMQGRVSAERRRKLFSDANTRTFDALTSNYHFNTNRREEFQDAGGGQFDALSDGLEGEISLPDKTRKTLPLNEVKALYQRGPLGDWRVHDNWNPGLYAPDRRLPGDFRNSLVVESPKISRGFSDEGDESSVSILPQGLRNISEHVNMSKESHSSQRFRSSNLARFRSRQEFQDLKENDIIIIRDRAISAEYDDDVDDEASRISRRLSYKGPINTTEGSYQDIGTRNTVAFHENNPGYVIANRQETIRRLERGERPLLEQKEILRRTAQAYQRLPEVKERRKAEQKKEEAEHRRRLVREMEARRRGKLL